jgi:hypothetical protein
MNIGMAGITGTISFCKLQRSMALLTGNLLVLPDQGKFCSVVVERNFLQIHTPACSFMTVRTTVFKTITVRRFLR